MNENFIPQLSLVAVESNKIIGYILFTKAYINDDIVLALAPVSVIPEFQKKGIGRPL